MNPAHDAVSGWSTLLHEISQLALSPVGKERSLRLGPVSEAEQVTRQQQLTREMQGLLQGSLGLWNQYPQLPLLAQPGQLLNQTSPEFWKQFAQWLAFSRRLKQQLHERRQQYPQIYQKLSNLHLPEELEKPLQEQLKQAKAPKLSDDLKRKLAQKFKAISQGQQVLADLEQIYARARLAQNYQGQIPAQSPVGDWHLPNLYPPLLQLQRQRAYPHGWDIQLSGQTRIVLLTGPHDSGKSTLLQSLGLAAMMHQTGLPLPTQRDAIMPIFRQIKLLQRGNERFHQHLEQLQALLKSASPHSLILLDDPLAGTHSGEAYALLRSLLEEFEKRGATVIVATHLTRVATLAEQRNHWQSWRLEVNGPKNSKEYRLVNGPPGLSQALEQTKGLWPENVLKQAQSYYRELSQQIQPKTPSVISAKPQPKAPAPTAAGREKQILKPVTQQIALGSHVYIRPLNLYGELLSQPDKNGYVSVQAGGKKWEVAARDVLLSSKRKEKKGDHSGVSIQTHTVVDSHCDLHNLRVHEALALLEKFLDAAYQQNLRQVFIVHGKGDGILKRAVHDYLAESFYVQSFRLGHVGEGDTGVTVVNLH